MISEFGRTTDGARVHRVALSHSGLSASVLTLGAILQDLRAGDRSVTVGGAQLDAYDNGPLRYFGAVIGPVAGRIGGARGMIGDIAVEMEAVEGPNALHSGAAGLHRKVWKTEERTPTSVALACRATAGEGGLPGNRRFRARYALEEGALSLTLEAETDAPTWINLTQHSYWHLGGPPGIDGHRLELAAEKYLPIDSATLPTGDRAPVAQTRFDFTAARVLSPKDKLDHCFCLRDGPGPLAPAAVLSAPDGATLSLSTEAPGLQVHTGDGVAVAPEIALGGATWPARPGLALEPQDWPDAPNHLDFPSIRLDPGRVWRRRSVFALRSP